MRKSIAFVTAFEKLGQRRIDSIIESSLCIESLSCRNFAKVKWLARRVGPLIISAWTLILLAESHCSYHTYPESRYIAAGCAAYAVDLMNKIRKALELGGPTFVHTLDPCPKGWDYHPQYSQELGHLAVECGIWPLYEVIDGVCNLTGPTRQIAEGRKKRKPVYEYLKRQGRFAHFADEDVEHFQHEVDKMWTEWLIPGVIPFTIAAKDQTILKIDKKPLHEQKTA